MISIHVLRVEDDPAVSLAQRRHSDFNPRPPCGGRRLHCDLLRRHARFQSTSSVWRTTQWFGRSFLNIEISIHVLRVEADSFICLFR